MLRQVEVEYRDGRVVSETLRFVVVHSSQLARQQIQACTAAPAQEAAALAAHVHHVQGRWFACEADAEAAIAPVWLEKAERIAALAMLTVVGLLVSSIMQRQVRLCLRTYDQQLPGNKGPTAIPTAAVVLALFAQIALIQLWVSDHEVAQVYGLQPYHLLICDAFGLDHSWYAAPSARGGFDAQDYQRLTAVEGEPSMAFCVNQWLERMPFFALVFWPTAAGGHLNLNEVEPAQHSFWKVLVCRESLGVIYGLARPRLGMVYALTCSVLCTVLSGATTV